MKIQVNKCPDTGQLFECDEEYKKHRRSFLAKKREKEKFESKRKIELNWIAEEKLKINKAADILPWILANQDRLMKIYNRYKSSGFWFCNGTFSEGDVLSTLHFTHLRFNHSVSNTHSCPHNGVTNFMCDPTKPKGYPGWQGRIEGVLDRVKEKGDYPSSGLLNFIGIHTGTGGGGNKCWGYDVRIFLADWPGLQQEYSDIIFEHEVARYEDEQKRIISRLKGNRWA